MRIGIDMWMRDILMAIISMKKTITGTSESDKRKGRHVPRVHVTVEVVIV
jgi:hypothetical protein